MSSVSKYLIIGGAFLVGYALKYFSEKKVSAQLQTTRKIIKQINYQVYTFCIPFAQAIRQHLKLGPPPQDISIYLRKQLAKAYESKQQLILFKYNFSRDQYGIALEKYKEDNFIENEKRQIEKVLEDTVTKGKIDLCLLQEINKLHNQQQILNIYRLMCENICLLVFGKLQESKRKDPSFNSKDQFQFKAAIRQLDIYDFKVKFIEQHGFKKQWGCPNLVFLKLYERLKRDSEQLKTEFTFIDAAYAKIIEVLCDQFQDYDKPKIRIFMDEQIKRLKAAYRPNPNILKIFPTDKKLRSDQRIVTRQLIPKSLEEKGTSERRMDNLNGKQELNILREQLEIKQNSEINRII